MPGDDDQADPQGASDQTAAEQAGPTADPQAQDPADGPNIDDLPDPVAEVNGTEISKDEFVTVFEGQYQQMAMQAQMSGQPVDEEQLRDQAIEGMVGTTLLEQEAEDRGLQVSDDEIDAELAEFAETNQVSTDEFVSMMGEQGMDRDAVMEQIESQLLVEKLVAQEYGEFTATEDEVQAAYDQVAEQQAMSGQGGQELPPLEDVRGEIEDQLETQQQAEDMQTLFEELREDADVTVHI